MTPPERLPDLVRARDIALDAFLAGVVAVVTVVLPHPDAASGRSIAGLAAAAAGVACLALTGRRRWPQAVLAVVLVATAAAILLAHGQPVFSFAAAVALYTIAAQASRRATLFAVITCSLTLTVSVAVVAAGRDLSFLLDTAIGSLTPVVLAAAVGDAVRSRRGYLAAMRDRAVRAEHTREEEARRRVAEERLRIARELHDGVAHQVAVVSVQAGLASHLVLKQPAAAQEALEQVRAASASILDELAGILNVLRQPDDRTLLDPAPGLRQLDDLVASYVKSGLPVNCSTAGQPRPLDGNADLVAYRVVQEALTNAHKHGTRGATLAVTYLPTAVTLEVVNRVAQPPAEKHGAGHGLLGMQERAAAVGGELKVGCSSPSEFRIRLTLPTPVAVG